MAMASLAAEIVLSDSARRRKYTKAAWCEVYSLARLWFERLRLSGRDSARSQRDEKEHESQQRAAIAAFLASHHYDHTRGMMISTTEEKSVGVIADKGDVARKVVWCLTGVRLPAPHERLKSAHLDGIMRKVRHWSAPFVQYQSTACPSNPAVSSPHKLTSRRMP